MEQLTKTSTPKGLTNLLNETMHITIIFPSNKKIIYINEDVDHWISLFPHREKHLPWSFGIYNPPEFLTGANTKHGMLVSIRKRTATTSRCGEVVWISWTLVIESQRWLLEVVIQDRDTHIDVISWPWLGFQYRQVGANDRKLPYQLPGVIPTESSNFLFCGLQQVGVSQCLLYRGS